MTADRLIWSPPSVSTTEEYQFRILVKDSAGMVGFKDWTVTVHPSNATNDPPTIDISGFEIDPDDNDGLIGEPLLPAAKELRGYSIQIQGIDSDPQDQGNLKYYLRDTELGDGTIIEVPEWLSIDRNTGRLSGRPGSEHIGSTHVTIRVSDGRLYNENGVVKEGFTEQSFAIKVLERDDLNTPPIVTQISGFAGRVGQQITYQIQAEDADYDELTFTLNSGPKGMVVDPVTGVINWVATKDLVDQVVPVSISVSDGRATTEMSFRVAVAGENRDPVITAEFPDSVTYLEYLHQLTGYDPDGDTVLFNLAQHPTDMEVLTDVQTGEPYLSWWVDDNENLDEIPEGKHRITVRLFDGVGGFSERKYLIDFDKFTEPYLFEFKQPSWREGVTANAYAYIVSDQEIQNFASTIRLSNESYANGVRIKNIYDYNFDESNSFGTFYGYVVQMEWTPQYAGTYETVLRAANDNGLAEFKIDFEVLEWVEENTAPVLQDVLLGPYTKDVPFVPLVEAIDAEGHEIKYEYFIDNVPLQAADNGFVFTESGVFDVTVRATDITDVRRNIGLINNGIAAPDAATGTGWIMHSSADIFSRFSANPPFNNNSNHLLAVRYQNDQWYFAANETWHAFTPVVDDLLIAEVDYTNDTITSLENQFGVVNGIHTGFTNKPGEVLEFHANQWNGLTNLGEFTVNPAPVEEGGYVSGDFYTHFTDSMYSERTYTVAVLENAAPGIIYGYEGTAVDNQDYILPLLHIQDLNPDDTVQVILNKEAVEAGMTLVPKVNGGEYEWELKWTNSDMVNWIDGREMPLYLPVEITAIDNHGASSFIQFNLPVRDADATLALLDASEYEFRIAANRHWEQQFELASDGGYELAYEISSPTEEDLPDGLEIGYEDGVFYWTPSADLLIDYDENGNQIRLDEIDIPVQVTVTLVDASANTTETGVFTITVVDPALFYPFEPEIDVQATPPPTAATINQLFAYDPQLLPAEPEHAGQPVIWSLEKAPDGMQIDSETGHITWVPPQSLVNTYQVVTIRTAGTQGGGNTLSFTLEVNGSNIPPVLQTTFPTIWEEGVTMQFDAKGLDPEGHHLVYAITNADGTEVTESISIDENTGAVIWDAPTSGVFDYVIRISEKYNPDSFVEQAFPLAIVPNDPNDPLNYEPLILGSPQGKYATTGIEFAFDFDVADFDQTETPHLYEVIGGDGTATVDTDGVFRWTPVVGDTGIRTFQLKVTDVPLGVGAVPNERYLTFQLNAIDNNLPTIVAYEDLTAYVATTFVHNVKASDPDGDPVTFALQGEVPDGMKIDPVSGQIRWDVPNSSTAGTVDNVQIAVSDKYGATTYQDLVITISTEDKSAPTIIFYVMDSEGNVIPATEELESEGYLDYDLWVYFRDNRGIHLPDDSQNGSWGLTVKNTGADDVSIGMTYDEYFGSQVGETPEHGLWKVDLIPPNSGNAGLNQGLLEIEIEAYDEAGNKSTRYARYYVRDQDAYQYGKILNLNENSEPITDYFEVRGNAYNYEINGQSGLWEYGKYNLKLTSMEDPDDFIYLAKNEIASVTDGILGIVDGTMIPTGQYRLYLEVLCPLGCIQYVDERVIEVQNEARLGDANLAFTDLDVTLGGVPIPLIRTYSSGLVGELDEDGNGSFESDFSAGWNLNFLNSKITVSHPDGVTTSLQDAMAENTRVFVTLPDGTVERFNFDAIPAGDVYIPYLNSDPGSNSQLFVKDIDENLRFILDEARNDGTYLSTSGNLPSVASNFGSAWILQTENGLKYIFDIETGELTGIEDLNDGRIDILTSEDGLTITITTRNTGSGNAYGYGTPVEKIVIHRELVEGSNPADQRFRVVSIEDPIDEDDPTTTEVDEDLVISYQYGELDANGDVIIEGVDVENLAKVVHRDETTEGYRYENEFFQHHVTGLVDNDNVQVFTLNYFETTDREDKDYGRLESTSNANGQDTSFEFDFEFENGKKAKLTTVAGVSVEEVYNGLGFVERTVQLVHDEPGDPTQNRYLVSVTDYYLRGIVRKQSKPFYVIGADDRFTAQPAEGPNGESPWATEYTYDEDDRPLTVEDSQGNVTVYVYDDENGIFQTIVNGVTSWRFVDRETGRVIETYDSVAGSGLLQNHLAYYYDDFGRQTETVQHYQDGSQITRNQNSYDSSGQLVWTKSYGQPTQYFAYNGNGRQTHSWQSVLDPAGTGDYITTVQVIIDSYAGPDNPFVTVNDADFGSQTVQFRVVSATPYTELDTQLLKSKIQGFETDADVTKVSESSSILDNSGRTVQSRSLSTDADGLQVWYLSETVFDSAGRVVYQTNQHREDLPATEITGTQNYYDAEGRVWKTEQRIGLEISITYDGLGYGESAVLAGHEGTVLSYSETVYDAATGRVTSTTRYSTDQASSGLTSTTLVNRKGQTTETRSESWNADGSGKVTYITRTVYDDQDRVVLQTDSYLEGDVVYATQTVYDPHNNQSQTIRRKNVIITIDANNETSIATETDWGEALYSSISYSDQGRVWKSVDAQGNETLYEYDAWGRQIATVEPAVEIDGQQVRHRSETIYDDFGRVYQQRSNIIHDEVNGQHDDTNVQVMTYVYDAYDRVEKNVYDDGSFGQVRFDEQGRTIAESIQVAAGTVLVWSAVKNSFEDSSGNTIATRTMEYNVLGQLVAVNLPAVADPNNGGALTSPRYEYRYDADGQQTLIVDPLGRETRLEYNQLGQQVNRQLPLHFGEDGIQGTADDSSANDFQERYEYDIRGRRVLHVSFEGVHTVNVYDDLTGRMTEVQYFADAATYNNGTGTPDENRVFSFDDRGRVISVQHFVGGQLQRTETTTYNAEGYVDTITTPEGVIHYQYDVFGRKEFTKFYGSDFSPANSDDYDNVTQYVYDNLGRLSQVQVIERGNTVVDIDSGTAGDQPDTTTYHYNLLGSLDQTVYSSGLIHEYDYDSLGRLEELYHWVDANQDGVRDSNELRASFDYTLRADGKRVGAVEYIWDADGTLASSSHFDWVYDSAGRLISETAEITVGISDHEYRLEWTYDLTGNRVQQEEFLDVNGSTPDEVTNYTFDANDRLLEEQFLVGGTESWTSEYEYDFTQQIGSIRYAPGQDPNNMLDHPLKSIAYEYDLQGRLKSAVTETAIGTNQPGVHQVSVAYQYDSAGNRVLSESVTVEDTSLGGTAVRTRVEYLTDASNSTGYSQVLQETHYAIDANGDIVAPSKKIVYAIGHDQISQTVYAWDEANDQWDDGRTDYFGTDGHGSVRVLWDMLTAIVNDAAAGAGNQIFHFDAYGNLLSFAGAAVPHTSYLYSGESFDSNLGQQYLRARWYNATTGRFNRLDPYFGNSIDPQSFHKYAYVHADPVQGIDPTGKMLGSLVAGLARITIRGAMLGAMSAVVTGKDPVKGAIIGAAMATGLFFAVGWEEQLVRPVPLNRVAEAKFYSKFADAAYRDRQPNQIVPAGWVEVDKLDSAAASGYFGRVFANANGEYIVAYAGTDDGPNWQTNVIQGLGQVGAEYRVALEDAKIWTQKAKGKIHFVGHSLGGGLASAAAVENNKFATTFNAAGLHPNSVNNLNAAAFLVTAFRVVGDPLSTIQDSNFGVLGFLMPDGVGNAYWIESTIGYNPYKLHVMEGVYNAVNRL